MEKYLGWYHDMTPIPYSLERVFHFWDLNAIWKPSFGSGFSWVLHLNTLGWIADKSLPNSAHVATLPAWPDFIKSDR